MTNIHDAIEQFHETKHIFMPDMTLKEFASLGFSKSGKTHNPFKALKTIHKYATLNFNALSDTHYDMNSRVLNLLPEGQKEHNQKEYLKFSKKAALRADVFRCVMYNLCEQMPNENKGNKYKRRLFGNQAHSFSFDPEKFSKQWKSKTKELREKLKQRKQPA